MQGSNAAELVLSIERQIADGVLTAGDRLPPVRTLAEQLDLAPNTVAAAYRRLGERGLVIGRGRSGTFISPRTPMAQAFEPEIPPGALDLARGNPDPKLLPTITPVLPDEPVLYGDALFVDELRALAGAALTADGVAVDHLTVVAGALDGFERILNAHVRPGDRIAIEDPAFYAVIDLLASMGLVAVPVEIDDEGMRPEALAAALDHGVSAVVHTPRGQNPFGSAVTAARATELRRVLATQPETLVVEDDYAAAVTGAPFFSLTTDRERWAVIRSAAKMYGPDLRVAFVAADSTTVRRVEGRLRLGPGWVSHLLQRTVASLMASTEVTAALQVAAETYSQRRTSLLHALSALDVDAHGAAGLNIWVPVTDESAAVAHLAGAGIAVRSGERFRVRTSPGIRVTTAAMPLDKVEHIAEAIANSIGRSPQTSRTA